ncbi:hypothetical protein XELAEV_18005674mg [Xenopus laevis]|uniref:Uncharacterized protein n=1 Tax=Xenopus laevis TaxID=8355 RepID=A0A974I3C3_XENLA|nr:hypothetical protein XELAEV_18005674mg [Xenopus laevis]
MKSLPFHKFGVSQRHWLSFSSLIIGYFLLSCHWSVLSSTHRLLSLQKRAREREGGCFAMAVEPRGQILPLFRQWNWARAYLIAEFRQIHEEYFLQHFTAYVPYISIFRISLRN